MQECQLQSQLFYFRKNFVQPCARSCTENIPTITETDIKLDKWKGICYMETDLFFACTDPNTGQCLIHTHELHLAVLAFSSTTNCL